MHTHGHRCSWHCIIPPYVLEQMLQHQNPAVRDAAMRTLLESERIRGQREMRSLVALAVAPGNGGRRTVYDCGNGIDLQAAKRARGEGEAAVADDSVNRAYDYLGLTRDFYAQVFQRNSIDGNGLPLSAYVHRGKNFMNAFWDGAEMVFGDGDGVVLGDTTRSIDVVAHELTHGVTENTAGLVYARQPGALNESISDVFGSLVKQYSKKQTANQADWLIGAEIFTPAVGGDALRSMKAPGTAYKGDPQPGHINGYHDLPLSDDQGGVHMFSGIPNKAFYAVAMTIGGNAWLAPGHIWYEALLASHQTTQFQGFADTTFAKAGQLYGTGSVEQKAVREGWDAVGIVIGANPQKGGVTPERDDGRGLAELRQTVESLSRQVDALAAAR